MKTLFLKSFGKDIENITLQATKDNLATIIEAVEKVESMSDIANLKKLKGFKTAYRIRSGDYRIGVFIENETVEFARVVHRKDIYKVFP